MKYKIVNQLYPERIKKIIFILDSGVHFLKPMNENLLQWSKVWVTLYFKVSLLHITCTSYYNNN